MEIALSVYFITAMNFFILFLLPFTELEFAFSLHFFFQTNLKFFQIFK